jgi:type II secretory pathway pseudopilin PulG
MARSASAALLALLALPLLAGVSAAQRDPDVDEAGRVVMQQLEAFRKDDYQAAFGFASRTIHDQFDPERFEAMVRGGYPEIARSVRANIDGSKRGDAGELYLFLHVQGENGRAVEAVYEMVKEAGAWRINGVVTRPDSSEKA